MLYKLSALLVTSHCALGGTGGSGQGYPQGTVYTVVARLGCKSAMIETGSALTAWTGLENTSYPHLVGDWFLAWKAAWGLNGA